MPDRTAAPATDGEGMPTERDWLEGVGSAALAFEAADFEFRIQEFDLVQEAWIPYLGSAALPDGYVARHTCARLNNDYAPHGRRFRVQRRAISAWKEIESNG